jgi:hypothetical protein
VLLWRTLSRTPGSCSCVLSRSPPGWIRTTDNIVSDSGRRRTPTRYHGLGALRLTSRLAPRMSARRSSIRVYIVCIGCIKNEFTDPRYRTQRFGSIFVDCTAVYTQSHTEARRSCIAIGHTGRRTGLGLGGEPGHSLISAAVRRASLTACRPCRCRAPQENKQTSAFGRSARRRREPSAECLRGGLLCVFGGEAGGASTRQHATPPPNVCGDVTTLFFQ